jgi:hypothetical protein
MNWMRVSAIGPCRKTSNIKFKTVNLLRKLQLNLVLSANINNPPKNGGFRLPLAFFAPCGQADSNILPVGDGISFGGRYLGLRLLNGGGRARESKIRLLRRIFCAPKVVLYTRIIER